MNIQMSKDLKLYAIIEQTRTLGPFQRFALWVQGCPFRCSHCMTPDALSFEQGYRVSIRQLAKAIVETESIEGITISGGEPFAQASQLAELIALVHEQRDLGVIVYSGYKYHALQRKAQRDDVEGQGIRNLLAVSDILIDGLYIEALNDGLSGRGSSNQQVHLLSERYREVAGDYYQQTQRAVEVHVLAHESMLVGIPGHEMLQRWQASLFSELHC